MLKNLSDTNTIYWDTLSSVVNDQSLHRARFNELSTVCQRRQLRSWEGEQDLADRLVYHWESSGTTVFRTTLWAELLAFQVQFRASLTIVRSWPNRRNVLLLYPTDSVKKKGIRPNQKMREKWSKTFYRNKQHSMSHRYRHHPHQVTVQQVQRFSRPDGRRRRRKNFIGRKKHSNHLLLISPAVFHHYHFNN